MAKRKKQRRSNGLVDGLNAILTLIVFGLIIIVGLGYFGIQRFYTPNEVAEVSTFNVPRGSTLASISENLETAGLIADATTFSIGARVTEKQSALKAGEFNIAPNSSMADILKELTEGRAITYSVTIPEGWTSWEAVQRINATEFLTGEITEIPAEGSLLPNTYSFERGQDRNLIVEQMAEAMEEAVAEIWAGRAEDLPISTPEEMVILASVVEKETGLATERPEVAAVFENRLNRGMRLQSDPTIIYGITLGQGGLGRGLRRSEIDTKTDYNTYQIDGLPIGPIANPGLEALKAVANPAETEAIFFVAAGATPDLGHVFANTLAEHNDNVAAYRRIVAEYEAEREAREAEAAEEAAAD